MAPLRTHPHSAYGRADSAARAFRFPPLNSPGRPSATLTSQWRGATWGPQEEDLTHSIYHCGVSCTGLTPVAQLVGLASGQLPTEPNRQWKEADLPPL